MLHNGLLRNCSGDGRKKKKKKKPKKKKTEQGDPPRIGLSKFYPDGIYPEGEIQLYKDECVGRPVIFLIGLQDTNLSETAIPGASRQKKNDTMNAWQMRIPRPLIKAFDELPRFIG
jgi:hypothetical protein